jgi:hypothetical protein
MGMDLHIDRRNAQEVEDILDGLGAFRYSVYEDDHSGDAVFVFNDVTIDGYDLITQGLIRLGLY